MTQQVANRCLEPFFTTKAGNGSGLGLSVCHGIAKRHGGAIEIDTALGQGTTFRVTLPRVAEREAAKPETTEPTTQKLSVLYIDDDHRLRELATRIFRRLGHSVDVAQGGAEGLELARRHRYDVVVTDLAMPGINGREVTRQVKSMRPHLPVILVTGWASSAELEPGPSSVVPDQVVSKPFTASKLRAALQAVCAREGIEN
jgi:CheY-like chemotaxis protein